MSLGLYGYLDVFGGYTPDYECEISSLLTNNESLTIFRSDDECTYDVYENISEIITTMTCDEWSYDDTYMKSTKITEYDFICDKDYVFETAYSVEQVGYVIGTLIFSIYADKLGRKPVFIFILGVMTILGIIQFFMKNFFAYTAIGLLINIFATGTDSICVTLILELVSTKRRTSFGMGMEYVWVIVLTSLSLFAYFINSWRNLGLAMFIILGVITVLSFWLVQESFTWLISVNEIDKARKVLDWIGKFNCLTNSSKYQARRKEVDEDLRRLKLYNKTRPAEKNNMLTVGEMFKEIFKHPKFRLYTFVMTFNYFVTALIYDGLQYLNAEVGENIFINWTALSLAEFPAQIICHIFLARFGRRLSTSIYLIVCGITLIITSVIFTCKIFYSS